MKWSQARQLISSQKPLKGTLYRGVESQGTIVKSSKSELEIGPINWELPKNVKLVRSDRVWLYESGSNEWLTWENAEKEGLPVFELLDPRFYLALDAPVHRSETPLPFEGIRLRFSFSPDEIFNKIKLSQELREWCLEIVGEYHEVEFILKNDTLRAMSQRDFWLTDETITVLFQEVGVVIPAQLFNSALR